MAILMISVFRPLRHLCPLLLALIIAVALLSSPCLASPGSQSVTLRSSEFVFSTSMSDSLITTQTSTYPLLNANVPASNKDAVFTSFVIPFGSACPEKDGLLLTSNLTLSADPSRYIAFVSTAAAPCSLSKRVEYVQSRQIKTMFFYGEPLSFMNEILDPALKVAVWGMATSSGEAILDRWKFVATNRNGASVPAVSVTGVALSDLNVKLQLTMMLDDSFLSGVWYASFLFLAHLWAHVSF